jgi:hypothetical protein
MNSQEAVLSRAKREIFGRWDPEPARGRRPGNLERRAVGRECPCASPMANGKENRESFLAKTTQFQLRQYPQYSCEATQPAEIDLAGLARKSISSVSLFRLPLRRKYHPSCGRCAAQLKR